MIRLLKPKRKQHILPRIHFQFDYDELKHHRETKSLRVNYGGKLNVHRFHRGNHVLLPYQKIELLYEHKIHGLTAGKLAKKFGISKSLGRLCINQYKNSG